MPRYMCSDKKTELVKDYKNKSIVVGDSLYVRGSCLSSYTSDDKKQCVDVVSVDPLTVKHEGRKYKINAEDVISKISKHVGANRFANDDCNVRPVQFCLSSILSSLSIGVGHDKERKFEMGDVTVGELSWNPYVYDADGHKVRYQRDFVWTVDDNKMLIESIYNGVDCGKLLVRKRDFSELESMYAKGERELYFSEIVDGKQRLNAIVKFINCEYSDLNGDYFNDLSDYAQHKFTEGFHFSYSEMRNATDDQVIRQFLKMNHLGVPQSKEHIEFVANINRGYNDRQKDNKPTPSP